MRYPSDLTDAEWALIQHCFEPKERRGSTCRHPRKQVVDAILYVVKSGCQWRMLPKEYPNWKTVYDHYSKWSKRGVWEAALDHLNRIHRKKTSVRPRRVMALLTHKALKPSMQAKNEG